MHQKSEVVKFKQFETILTNASDCKNAKIWPGNGEGYISHVHKQCMRERGIHNELSVAHCHQHNGVAEGPTARLLNAHEL